MTLLIPANRVCPDKMTRYPVTGINPMLWIKTENENYTVASIDGFIVTNKKLRGYSFGSVKNLNAASSNVECYLANNTTNPFPGDIDAIIYDHKQDKFVAIVEFRTHNINSPSEKEHIGKYGEQDWRRCNVLFDLKDNFQKKVGYNPKLFFVVWGTNPNTNNHSKIKIDLIERERIIKSFLFPQPEYNIFSSDLFNFILKAANETTVR